MKLNIHSSVQSFLAEAQASLEADEVVNGLMLGLALRMRDDPFPGAEDAYLATVMDDAGMALAALMTRLNVILYSPRPNAGQAVYLVAQNLAASGRPTPGVLAPAALADEFAACWQQITGQPGRMGMRQRIYELRQVLPPSQPGGVFRAAQESEHDFLIEWALAFQREALGEEDREAAQRVIEAGLAQGRLFVWEDAQAVVSMAAASRPTAHGMTVNLVYTPPDRRGKGYASACVAALSQHILDTGKQYCTLFTDLSNPTSNSIYQKIGYQPVCDFNEILFGRD